MYFINQKNNVYIFIPSSFFFFLANILYQFTENEDNTPAMLLPTIQSICLERA